MKQYYGKPNKNGTQKPLQVVYVLNKHGEPLHPTTRCWRVRKLLESGKAVVVSNNPFTIRLKYEVQGEVQPVILGIDPGRENIGLCAVDSKGRPVLLANVKAHNKSIKKNMDLRRANRSARRQHFRKKKQRKALRKKGRVLKSDSRASFGNKQVPVAYTSYPRMEGSIEQKVIHGQEAQFANRGRSENWINPSGNQLLQATRHSVEKVCNLLPVKKIVLEYNSYDSQRAKNPGIKGKKYQQGPLYGFKNPKDYVSQRQERKCLLCGGVIEEVHHIVPRSKGGSNSPSNLAGLCKSCHHLVHTSEEARNDFEEKMDGSSQTEGISLVNSVMPALLEDLSSFCDSRKLDLYLTDGKKTYETRENLNLPKDHCIDAYAIALSIFSNVRQSRIPKRFPVFRWERFKKKSANVINTVGSRKYYFNGKLVATNRHKALEQETDSLEEYRENYISRHGETAWKKHESKLVVVPANRTYTVKKAKSRENRSPTGMVDSRGKEVFWHPGDTVLYEKKNRKEVFVVAYVNYSKHALVHNDKRTGKPAKSKSPKLCRKLCGGSIVQTGVDYRYRC